MKELFKCIEAKENIKIINNICIEGVEEMLSRAIENSNIEDIEPIITPSGTIIYIVPADIPTEKINKKYPKLTTLDLGECEKKLKSE